LAYPLDKNFFSKNSELTHVQAINLNFNFQNFKDKPMRIEYVVPNGEHQFKYTMFTSIQLDAQMEMYQQKLLNPPEGFLLIFNFLKNFF